MQLPASLQEIADVIGRDDALHLIEQAPKRRCGLPGKEGLRTMIYVPKRLKPNHRLVSILGEEKASKLVCEFGGEMLNPANDAENKRERRNSEIRQLARQGVDVGTIAERFGLSRRHAQNLTRGEIPHMENKAANDDTALDGPTN